MKGIDFMIEGMKIRTDLALEVREQFEQDVEIRGVALDEDYDSENDIRVTTVDIKNVYGAKKMGKPVGRYITIEAPAMQEKDEDYHAEVSEKISRELGRMLGRVTGDVLVVGLGNREVTPDALGPMVVDNLMVTRHLIKEFGSSVNASISVCAIAPGVMGQTGMETGEILKGIIDATKPEKVIVIDALASRSVSRLNSTVQITDTGISPGAGIGNNRRTLDRTSLGVDVIALGVPTVVDAGTIVRDNMEAALRSQELSEKEIEVFLGQVCNNGVQEMFVTPKNIDEAVKSISYTIAEAINGLLTVDIGSAQ